jgi:hypothetical protein
MLIACAILLAVPNAWAGPPYATDDPEPVEFRHWEIYLASQSARGADGWTLTAPHLEVNYGAAPDLQLHVIAPMAFVAPRGAPTEYGYGDTEVGVKWRFVHEGKYTPQVGIFPLLEIPTGDHDRGLGNGSTQVYLPLWIQKSVGDWQSYGGAGYWVHPGDGNRNWWFFGWQVQRHLVDALTIGGEIFHMTSQVDGGSAETRFNVGAQIDLTDVHHLLLSAGRGLTGSNTFQSYVAYQLTLGPE